VASGPVGSAPSPTRSIQPTIIEEPQRPTREPVVAERRKLVPVKRAVPVNESETTDASKPDVEVRRAEPVQARPRVERRTLLHSLFNNDDKKDD